VKFETASVDIVQRYEEFGSRLLAAESTLYRKRMLRSYCVNCLNFIMPCRLLKLALRCAYSVQISSF